MIGISARSTLAPAVVFTLLWWSAGTTAAAQTAPPHSGPILWVHAPLEGDGNNQDDPGYALYRDGYRLVLDERWEQAHRIFEELQRRFPRSDYRDDAAYWSAYSLKHTSPKAAIDAYHSFLDQYRKSSYFDDAVADLAEAEAATWKEFNAVADSARSAVIAPELQRLERELRKASRGYRRLGVPMVLQVEEALDAETRLRIDALYVIGETTKDEQAFQTLRRVAVNRAEPVPLREAALEALGTFPEHDVLPVFLEIAREDTHLTMQSYAVDLIALTPADTARKVEVLIDLYRTIPPSRREQRQTIFYTIADLGSIHAVDFLGEIALTSPDYETRREAVYYLGSIGSPSSRSILMKILLED